MKDQFASVDVLEVLVSSNLGDAVERMRRSSGYVAGAVYPGGYPVAAMGTGAPPVDVLRAIPMWVATNSVIDQVLFEVTVVGGAGSVSRVGVYQGDPKSLYPTTLLFDSGSQATDAGVSVRALPANIAIAQGSLLWLAFLCSVAAPTIRILGATCQPLLGVSAAGLNVYNAGWTVGVAGFPPLPNPFPNGATLVTIAGAVPLVCVRFAST